MNTLSQNQLYRHNLSLLTDLYQLTMAYGYWKNGLQNRKAVFHLYYRKNPFKGDFAIACGLENVIAYLQQFKFKKEEINYLKTLKGSDGKVLFEKDFLTYLAQLTFDCDIDAIPEGTIIFPNQPLIRVKGSLIQAQLIETALLNMINFPTLIATKAARIVAAAKGDTVLEFGLRRAQGIDGGISASRAAYIGGCHATSNVLAGKLFDIPIKGTHAHSWVMGFRSEKEAFEKYAHAMPNNCTLLVDTYNTIEGVKKAIEVGKNLRKKGYDLGGIRLDSGDLAALSIASRKLLNKAGFKKTKIVASNDLDEYEINRLKKQKAKIDVWGVGTRLATAYDQAALGGVYKLAAFKDKKKEWQYTVKLSEQTIKISNPGILQVRRFYHHSIPIGDIIYDGNNPIDKKRITMFVLNEKKKFFSMKESEDLLVPILRKGKLVYQLPNLHEIRQKTLEQIKLFKKVELANYPTGLEFQLAKLKSKLIKKLRPNH